MADFFLVAITFLVVVEVGPTFLLDFVKLLLEEAAEGLLFLSSSEELFSMTFLAFLAAETFVVVAILLLLTLLVATLDDLEFDFTELLFTAVVDFFPDDFSGDCCCFLGLLTLLFTSALDLAEEVGDTLFITAFFS